MDASSVDIVPRPSSHPMAPLRVGILGTAKIARAFCAGMAGSTEVQISAIASRNPDDARDFACEFGLWSADSYDALLENASIDAVYIPLPNALHAIWAERAINAGKHVLCEKPLAVSACQVRRIFDAAEQKNVYLREGYPYLAQEHATVLRRWIAEGAIGRVRLICTSGSAYFRDPSDIRLNPELGGGALFDLGSYALSLIRVVAGGRPRRVLAVSQRLSSGVDTTTLATLEFADGIVAQLACSFETASHRYATIAGDAGMIETNYLNHPPIGGPAVLRLRRGRVITSPMESVDVPEANGFRLEAESFARLIRGGTSEWSGVTPEESFDIAMMIAGIQHSAETGAWADIDGGSTLSRVQ